MAFTNKIYLTICYKIRALWHTSPFELHFIVKGEKVGFCSVVKGNRIECTSYKSTKDLNVKIERIFRFMASEHGNFWLFVMNFNSIITCKNNFFVKNTQSCKSIFLFWDWWIWSFSLLKRLNTKNHRAIFFSWIETLKWYDNPVQCMYSVTSKLKNFKFPCPISIALKLYLTLLGNPRRRHVVVCNILEPSEYLKF